MRKLSIFLLLVCALASRTSAGRLGVVKQLRFWDGVHGVDSSTGQHSWSDAMTSSTPVDREHFILDVLLQVQKPLMHSEMLQWAQVFNGDASMYKEPNNVYLRWFVEHATAHDLIGHTTTFDAWNWEHVQHVVGFYNFLVHAQDWTTFVQNVCYGRVHLNPVVFVTGLYMAVRDRPDTVDVVLPAMNEVLPEMFYENKVIEMAQEVDWGHLVGRSATKRPQFVDVIGVRRWMPMHWWSPWQNWGNIERSSSVMPVDVVSRSVVGSPVWWEEEEKVVVPVGHTSEGHVATQVTDDVGLKVFWNHVLTERFMQKVMAHKGSWNTGNTMSGSWNGGVSSGSGSKWNSWKKPSVDSWQQGKSWQSSGVDTEWPHHGGRSSSDHVVDKVWHVGHTDSHVDAWPSTSIHSDRLVHVNRRWHQPQQWWWNKKSDAGEKWNHDENWKHSGEWRTDTDKSWTVGDKGWVGGQKSWKDSDHKWNGEDWVDGEIGHSGDETSWTGGKATWPSSETTWRGGETSRTDGKTTWPGGEATWPGGETTWRGGETSWPGGKAKWPAGKTTWPGGETTWQGGETSWPGGKATWPGGETAWRGGETSWPGGKVTWPAGKTTWPGGETTWPGGKATWPGGETTWPGGKATWPGGESTWPGGETSWPGGKATWTGGKVKWTGGEKSWTGGKDVYNTRSRRSVVGVPSSSSTSMMRDARSGEIFVHNLQQMVARMNFDKIAMQAVAGKNWWWWNQQPRQVVVAVKEAVHQVVGEFKSVIDSVIDSRHISWDGDYVMQVISDILIGRDEEHGHAWEQMHMDVWRVVYDVIPGVTVHSTFVNLHEPVVQYLMEELVHLIQHYMQHAPAHNVDDWKMDSVRVYDVNVDQFVTYTEWHDSDLINVVDQQLLMSDVNNVEQLQKPVVARQRRLNHQPFTLTYEVGSEYSQRVVVRTLIGPKVDASGRPVHFTENSHNFIVVDAFATNLIAGRNMIQRHSHEITWTTRDVSTVTELYHHVFAAHSVWPTSEDVMVGCNCRYPHRLVIPRGTVQGLPVQIVVVVTPVVPEVESWHVDMDYLCGVGIPSIQWDHLPLNFPMDRHFESVQQLHVPNVMIKDTVIKHIEDYHS